MFVNVLKQCLLLFRQHYFHKGSVSWHQNTSFLRNFPYSKPEGERNNTNLSKFSSRKSNENCSLNLFSWMSGNNNRYFKIFRAVVISVVKSVVTVVYFSNFWESQERFKSLGRGAEGDKILKNCRLAEIKME